MLYLLHMPEEGGGAEHYVPISPRATVHLERALLAADDAARHIELKALLASDPATAEWALKVAARRTGNAVDTIDEAATWWSACLIPELAAALFAREDDVGDPTSSEWRLPALVAKLNAFELQLEHEKIESLKELAYGASHEINNPLANIAARAQTLCDDEPDPERQRKLLAIHRQAMRAHEMISDLMLFARPPKLQLARCDLRHTVERAVEEHRHAAADREIQILCDLGNEPIELAADETQLAVAIGELVTNALEAIGVGGQVQVGLRQATFADEQTAEITVCDDGPGVSADVRRHMFDPFFSGREAGRGLGFGLSKCWRIVTDHGGQVVVNQPADRGAEIAIRLPLRTNVVHNG